MRAEDGCSTRGEKENVIVTPRHVSQWSAAAARVAPLTATTAPLRFDGSVRPFRARSPCRFDYALPHECAPSESPPFEGMTQPDESNNGGGCNGQRATAAFAVRSLLAFRPPRFAVLFVWSLPLAASQ